MAFYISTPIPYSFTSKSSHSHNSDGCASKTSTLLNGIWVVFRDKMPVLTNQRQLPKMIGNVDINELSLKNFDKTFFHPNPGFYKISIDYEQNAAIS